MGMEMTTAPDTDDDLTQDERDYLEAFGLLDDDDADPVDFVVIVPDPGQ